MLTFLNFFFNSRISTLTVSLLFLTAAQAAADQTNPTFSAPAPYEITFAANPAKCLDMTALGQGDGTLVQLWDCLGVFQSNQIFALNPVVGDYGLGYEIISSNSGRCLDVVGLQTNDGTPIQQYDCLGANQTNQIWQFYSFQNGYQLRSAQSGKCLDLNSGDTTDGNKVQIWDCWNDGSNPNQLWNLTSPIPKTQGYEINLSANPSKCLDITGVSQADGALTQIYDCLGPNQINQIYTLNPVYGSYGAGFQIVSANSGKCLDVVAVGQSNGTRVQQYDCLGANQTNQVWQIIAYGNDYQFQSVNSGRCLDLNAGDTSNGNSVQIWDCGYGSNPNQLWSLTPEMTVQPQTASPCPSGQTCYFIDSQNGNDGNLGTSITTPWQTLNNIGNAQLNPGGFVFLKAGSVFNNQFLALHSGGAAGNPVTMTSYGSGAAPLIQGGQFGIIGYGYVSNISISNLHISNVAQHGIVSYGPSNNNWTISGCTIDSYVWTGILEVPAAENSATGWVVSGNVIGYANRAPVINYGAAGISLHGSVGALITKNQIATQNAYAIFLDNNANQTFSDSNTVSYNELTQNFSGISIYNSSNAFITHNKIHDGNGFGIGIDGNGSYSQFSTNALISYNTIQNMNIAPDGSVYNGIDINTNATNGRMFHNTIENIYYHSATFEGDGGPASGWLVNNNIFDSRRQLNSPNHSGLFFNAVEPYTETLFNNLILGNLNYPTIFGSTLALTDAPGYLYLQDFQNYGLAGGTQFNVDPMFNNVGAEDLSLQQGSPAIGAGVPIPGIGQYNQDLGALPFGQTSVLNF